MVNEHLLGQLGAWMFSARHGKNGSTFDERLLSMGGFISTEKYT